MKKFLLSASLLMMSAAAFAVTDGQTYATTNGISLENLWVFDRNHDETNFLASTLASTYSRTATTDGTTVYVGRSQDALGTIEKFDLATGAYLGQTILTVNGEQISGTLCANQIGLDEYNNLFVASYSANSDGTGALTMYLVDPSTGACTSVGDDLYFDGGIGRVDYCDVIGDLTGVNAGAAIMAGTSASDNLNVFWWKREQGATAWEGGWTGGSYYQAVTGTYPADQTGFGTGNVLRIVRDGSATGEVNMFYIDGFVSFPALYGNDGAMIDNIGNADLQTTDEDGNVSGTIPSPAAGTNGIAEGVVGDTNLMIYSLCQYNATPGCVAVITAVDEELSMSSMEYLWTIPADGLGETSDSGTRVHSLFSLPQDDGSAYILTYKCYNGMALYKASAEGSVNSISAAAAAKISVKGGIITISETAQSIELYNIAGQKVASAKNTNQLEASASGAYIVKAVVNGTPVVKKVIL